MIYQALENTSAAALGSFTTALEKTKTTIAASGRALLKLLSRHKLLVSDQALYLLLQKMVENGTAGETGLIWLLTMGLLHFPHD